MHLHIREEAIPIIRAAIDDSEKYLSSIKAHDKTLETVHPTAFGISTMTVVFTLSINEIDLETIDHFIYSEASEATFMGHRMTTTVPEKKKNKESFYNQLTVRVRDRLGKRAIKIFVNGVLHITGCKSIKDAIAVGNAACHVIESATLTLVDIVDFKVCMINSNFSIDQRLRLLEVKRIIETSDKDCNYDPEGYPAVKFKHGNASIFVFATGKIIVTGGKTFSDIFDGYKFVTDFIDKNIEGLRARPLVVP